MAWYLTLLRIKELTDENKPSRLMPIRNGDDAMMMMMMMMMMPWFFLGVPLPPVTQHLRLQIPYHCINYDDK